MRTIIGVRRYLGSREWLVAAALALAAGCGRAAAPAPAEDIGVARIAIMQAPGDTQCVRVTVAGSRTVIDAVDVTPGQATEFALTGLPLGSDSFSAEAFGVACAALTPSAVAAWVGDPVVAIVTVDPPVDVTLVLHRNGRANVGIDFQDDPDGGMPATGGTSGSGGIAGQAGSGAGGSGAGGSGVNGPITFAPAQVVPLPSPVAQMVSADFDGDGLADLAWGSVNGSVFLASNTAAGLPVPRQIAQLAGSTLALAAIDVNRDKLIDLVVAIPGGSPVVLIQVAPGTFTAPMTLSAPPLVALSVGDVNGDGAADLVGADGNGAVVLLQATGSTQQIFSSPFPAVAIALADFDGNSLLDIAIVGRTNGVETIMQVKPSVFVLGSITPVPGNANALVAGDLDGDGLIDAGVATDAGVSVLNGDGQGGLRVVASFPTNATGLVAADFNGDGRPDLATLNGPAVLVSRNLGNGFDLPAAFPAGPTPGTSLIAVSISPGAHPSLAVAQQVPLLALLRNTTP